MVWGLRMEEKSEMEGMENLNGGQTRQGKKKTTGKPPFLKLEELYRLLIN